MVYSFSTAFFFLLVIPCCLVTNALAPPVLLPLLVGRRQSSTTILHLLRDDDNDGACVPRITAASHAGKQHSQLCLGGGIQFVVRSSHGSGCHVFLSSAFGFTDRQSNDKDETVLDYWDANGNDYSIRQEQQQQQQALAAYNAAMQASADQVRWQHASRLAERRQRGLLMARLDMEARRSGALTVNQNSGVPKEGPFCLE